MSDSFHVVGTTPLLTSYVFGVERRVVEHEGTTFERDVVTHPGAVAMLAINDRGEIGLIRQYRTPFNEPGSSRRSVNYEKSSVARPTTGRFSVPS